MKISLNWLKDYIDLSGIPVDDIVHKLTMAGLEVEDVVNEREIYKDFIVGYVKERSKHPNADKLSLCTVSTGKEELQVVCGAPNVDAGQKVVFAPVGTLIPKGNFKIGKAKIRGTESFGMICAEDELELGDDHSGIMILDNSLKEGTPITEALGLDDVIMEIAITPNRPDALSHFGVARDLAALYNREFKIPEIKLEESSEDINNITAIEIIDSKNCPRYSARVVKNIELKESPEWLKKRLTKVGLRPINNIVDVTNYVMFETGQPLHSFDLERLNGPKIIVKSTGKEQKFTTLDSKERTLPAGTLMICDAEKEVAVAGIMGGENSEVYSTTKDILIESAYFNPSSIRKTSKALGLNTDAAYRFERGTNAGGTVYAAERAAQLIAEIGNGKIAKGIIDAYSNKIEEKTVTLRFERIKRILGYEIPADKVVDILEKLDIRVTDKSNSGLQLSIPLFRPDIEREIDIIEEVARIDGYDNIPTISKISISLGERHDESSFVDNIKTVANSLGFYEMINNPLVSEKKAALTGNPIPVLNPQSLDMAFLRTSLIPGALEVVSTNINYGEKNLCLFEVGNIFNKKEVSDIKRFDDFAENTQALFILTGMENEKEWYSNEKYYDFYRLKGLINSFFKKISLDNVLNDSYYFNSDTIYESFFTKNHGKNEIGKGGLIKKEVLKKFDINQDVYCFTVDIDALKSIPDEPKRYKEPLKYPKSFRDFAFVFDKAITYDEVKSFIDANGSENLKSVKLFDLFESDSLGAGKKSMAFSLEYFSELGTLKDDQVEKEFFSLIALITKKFNASLRGS